MSRGISETRLQQDIYTAFWNKYKHDETMRSRLYAINNNSHNRIKGALNRSLGVRKGVSDMHYICADRGVMFLEFKEPGGKGRQSEEQKEFQALVESMDLEYFIIESWEDFNAATNLNLQKK